MRLFYYQSILDQIGKDYFSSNDQSYIEDFLANNFTDKFEVKSNYDPVDVTFFASKT